MALKDFDRFKEALKLDLKKEWKHQLVDNIADEELEKLYKIYLEKYYELLIKSLPKEKYVN